MKEGSGWWGITWWLLEVGRWWLLGTGFEGLKLSVALAIGVVGKV